MLHLLDIVDRGLVRRVQGNDDGAHDAQETRDLADHAEALLEEDGGEDGTDDDGQCAHGGDEDGVGEGVGDEVADLANDHEGHAGPPVEVLEVAVALAGDLIVLFVGLEEADLFQDKGGSNKYTRADGEADADGLEGGRSFGTLDAEAASTEELVLHDG